VAGLKTATRTFLRAFYVYSSVALALAVVALPQAVIPAQAQQYVPVPPIDTPPPEAFFIVPAPAVCREGAVVTDQTLPDGGFLRLFTQVKVHMKGSATGACDWYFDGQFWLRQNRTIAVMTIDQMSPTSWRQPVYSNIGPVHNLDTRIPGETAPAGATTSFNEVGPHSFILQTTAIKTNCQIPQFSPYTFASLNAVSCTPAWVKAQKIIHAPPGTLSIYIPPSMWAQLSGPAIAAAAEWSDALVTVDVVQSDCGLGGNCVRVVEVPTVSGGCAETTPPVYDPATGEVSGVREIRLPTSPSSRDWRQRTPTRLERTMGHEFGHLKGLFHPPGCSIADSIMSEIPALPESEVCKSTTGMAIKPTQNDKPAGRSAYTNGVTRVCGPS
jgi:hypothetical protein